MADTREFAGTFVDFEDLDAVVAAVGTVDEFPRWVNMHSAV